MPNTNIAPKSGPAPKEQHRGSKRKRRARRLRDEAGLYLIRGAATALGTATVTFSIIWIRAHL